MRIYYLFLIKQEYLELFRKNSYSLYKMLLNLKKLKTTDFRYGIIIYKELCNPISIKLLNSYIDNKIKYKKINNKIKKIDCSEDIYLEIKYSCIIVKTNSISPSIFKLFNIYNKNLFVCDFNNNVYFWLRDLYMKH